MFLITDGNQHQPNVQRGEHPYQPKTPIKATCSCYNSIIALLHDSVTSTFALRQLLLISESPTAGVRHLLYRAGSYHSMEVSSSQHIIVGLHIISIELMKLALSTEL